MGRTRNTRTNGSVFDEKTIEAVSEKGTSERGHPMRCHRCGGAMTYEKFYGICEHFHGWRCIVCGEIVDQIILENRNDFRESRIVERTGEIRKTRNVKRQSLPE